MQSEPGKSAYLSLFSGTDLYVYLVFHSYLFPNEAKCLNRESAQKRKKKHSVRKIPDQKNQCNRQKNSVIWSATNYYWLRLPTFAEKTTINVNIIMIHRDITNYQYELDILRALACILVIWQHVTECYYIQPDFTINNSPDITMIGWINSLTPIEVPLFVMISGYFLLPMKSDLTQFFRKRALRVVYPSSYGVLCMPYTTISNATIQYKMLSTTFCIFPSTSEQKSDIYGLFIWFWDYIYWLQSYHPGWNNVPKNNCRDIFACGDSPIASPTFILFSPPYWENAFGIPPQCCTILQGLQAITYWDFTSDAITVYPHGHPSFSSLQGICLLPFSTNTE